MLLNHLNLFFHRHHSVGANEANQAQGKRNAEGTVKRILRRETVRHRVAHLRDFSAEHITGQVVLRSHLRATLGHNNLACDVDATRLESGVCFVEQIDVVNQAVAVTCPTENFVIVGADVHKVTGLLSVFGMRHGNLFHGVVVVLVLLCEDWHNGFLSFLV